MFGFRIVKVNHLGAEPPFTEHIVLTPGLNGRILGRWQPERHFLIGGHPLRSHPLAIGY